MNLDPRLEVTLVSKKTKDQVLEIITTNTKLVDSTISTETAKFNGQINSDGFRISLSIKTPQNALPLVTGLIEDTSRGSIIFLKLRLFPAALLYLKFSTILCVLIGSVFLILAGSVNITSAAILIALVNYTVLCLNFYKRANETIEELKAILEYE